MKSTTVYIDQHKESLLEEVSDSGITVRYAFLRSRETRQNDKAGEDFLAFHLEAGRVAFALCDGVSQSFSGLTASQRLGKKLLEWLWMELPRLDLSLKPGNPESNHVEVARAAAQLARVLNDYSGVVAEEIGRMDLSHMVNDILREVLIERRDLHGTQTNFTCGYIEIPSSAFPYGRLILFWLGDAKLRRLIGGRDLTNELAESWNTDERWSSKRGVIGEIHSFMDIPYKVSTLVAHSDGLDPFPVEWYQPSLAADILNDHFRGLWEKPASDDVSFIEINVQNILYPDVVVPSVPEKAPAPAVLQVPVESPAEAQPTDAAVHVPVPSDPPAQALPEQGGTKPELIEKLPKSAAEDHRNRRRRRVVIGTSPIVDLPQQGSQEEDAGWLQALRRFFQGLFG